jgi:hypothetical protein
MVSYQGAGNFALGIIFLTSYRRYPKFLLLAHMTQGDILRLMLTMRDLIMPKRLLNLEITIPYAEHLIPLVRKI